MMPCESDARRRWAICQLLYQPHSWHLSAEELVEGWQAPLLPLGFALSQLAAAATQLSCSGESARVGGGIATDIAM